VARPLRGRALLFAPPCARSRARSARPTSVGTRICAACASCAPVFASFAAFCSELFRVSPRRARRTRRKTGMPVFGAEPVTVPSGQEGPQPALAALVCGAELVTVGVARDVPVAGNVAGQYPDSARARDDRVTTPRLSQFQLLLFHLAPARYVM
jgi:hypothetical protein